MDAWHLVISPPQRTDWTSQPCPKPADDGTRYHDRAAVPDVELRQSLRRTLERIDEALNRPPTPSRCGYCRGALTPGATFCCGCGTDFLAAVEHRAAHPPQLIPIDDELVEIEFRGGKIIGIR